MNPESPTPTPSAGIASENACAVMRWDPSLKVEGSAVLASMREWPTGRYVTLSAYESQSRHFTEEIERKNKLISKLDDSLERLTPDRPKGGGEEGYVAADRDPDAQLWITDQETGKSYLREEGKLLDLTAKVYDLVKSGKDAWTRLA